MCPGDEGNRSGRGHKLRFLEERGPGDARVLPGVGSTPRPTPGTGTGKQQDQMVPDNSRAQLPDPSSQGTRMKHLGPFPLFLRTKTHLLEGSSWQMGVTDPVILSPNPGSRSPFPSGLQPKSAVKTEVGKLFFSSTWPQVGRMEASPRPLETVLTARPAP